MAVVEVVAAVAAADGETSVKEKQIGGPMNFYQSVIHKTVTTHVNLMLKHGVLSILLYVQRTFQTAKEEQRSRP